MFEEYVYTYVYVCTCNMYVEQPSWSSELTKTLVFTFSQAAQGRQLFQKDEDPPQLSGTSNYSAYICTGQIG